MPYEWAALGRFLNSFDDGADGLWYGQFLHRGMREAYGRWSTGLSIPYPLAIRAP